MLTVLVIVCWLLLGAAVGIVEARHGHWRRGWVVFAPLGPFAIPFARAVRRRERAVDVPMVLSRGRLGPGTFDVLVGIDGSCASTTAATEVARLFGTRLNRLTLAAVLDYETALPHDDAVLDREPWDEETTARAALERTADELVGLGCVMPERVLLAGNPPDTLNAHAVAGDYDMIAIGARGHGISKLLLGSCASRLAGKGRVPVLVVPTRRSAERSGSLVVPGRSTR